MKRHAKLQILKQEIKNHKRSCKKRFSAAQAQIFLYDLMLSFSSKQISFYIILVFAFDKIEMFCQNTNVFRYIGIRMRAHIRMVESAAMSNYYEICKHICACF